MNKRANYSRRISREEGNQNFIYLLDTAAEQKISCFVNLPVGKVQGLVGPWANVPC